MQRARRHRPAREPAAQRVRTRARWPRSTSTGVATCSATTPRASLERLAELTRDARGGRADRAEGGPARADAEGPAQDRSRTRCATCSRSWPRTRSASTRSRDRGHRPRARPTRPSPTSSATRSTSTSSARSATPSGAPAARGTPVRLAPDDFEIERTEHLTRAVDGADARPVAVDADARQLPAGQEGGDGAALADLAAVPPRLPRHRRLQRDGPGAQGRAAARGVVGLRLRHEHAARASMLARQLLARQTGTSRSS